MATYKQGILGPFSGKVGTVVGSSWRGVSYIRSLATKVANPRTPSQTSVRNRLATCVQKLKVFAKVFRLGFPNAGSTGAWSTGVKLNLPQTLEKTQGQGDWELNAKDIVLTKGSMAFAGDVVYDDGDIQVDWDVDATGTFEDGTVVVVFYNETLGRVVYFTAPYEDGSLSASVDDSLLGEGQSMHLYSFAATGQLASSVSYKKLA